MALKVDVIRPDDLLFLQIECHNLQLDPGSLSEPVLIPEDATQSAYLVVTFPPQTIAEEALYETLPALEGDAKRQNTETPQEKERREKSSGGSLPLERILRTGSLRARIGQPSRLVFQLPANSNPRIPYTIAGLLNWTDLTLSVSPLANIAPKPTAEERSQAPAIAPPTPLETAIEIPYRLILSPNSDVTWQHELYPKTHAGRTELWHTRLTHRGKSNETNPGDDLGNDPGDNPGNNPENAPRKPIELSRARPAPLRALWSPDYVAKPSQPNITWPILGKPDEWAGQSVLTAMNGRDRHEIVILTSAFWGFVKSRTDLATYEPQPIQAEQVMLSALGGWLKSRGNWNPPTEWIFRRPSPIDPINPIIIDPVIVDPLRLNPDDPTQTHPAQNNPAQTDEGEVAIRADAKASATAPASFNTMPEALHPPFAFPLSPFPFLPSNQPEALAPLRFGRLGTDLNLSEWVHVATQGRDHYVRIVYEGYLYPFGHRAALIKVTERKFREVNGVPYAYLVQRMYIVVRQPLKDYRLNNDQQEALPLAGRAMPLKQVRMTTVVTPDIDLPVPLVGSPADVNPEYSFWIRVAGQDFRFHAVGQDEGRHQVDFTTALIFVPNSDAGNNGRVNTIRKLYNQSGDRRLCNVPGQAITYAKPNGEDSDNTTLVTRSLLFDTDNFAKAKFIPKLAQAAVHLAAVEQLLGTTAPTDIRYFPNYLNQDFDGGNEVFAELLAPLTSKFSADKGGGIATPDLSIKGVTRKLGAIAGDLAKAAIDSFDPKDFFKDVADSATLFGKLKLTDLISAGGFSNAPKVQFFPETTPPSVKLDWKPQIEEVEAGFFRFKKEAGSSLVIQGLVEQPMGGGGGRSQFTGELTNFYLEFFSVVKLSFDAFRFKAETGQKTEVNVQLKGDNALEFLGDLEFVNDLKNIIPPGLFGDGPSLELTPQPAIRAGFSIGLPPVEVGVFALKDVSLGAALTLPFLNGSPLFDFNISERQRPFNLTIAFFGGGGFFRLQLDTQAVRIIEAAFEFGASASINLGVASGGVYIMAGIYFKLETKPDGKKKATLAGYFRMGGNLTVLGFISVSLEFNLSFTYEEVGKATGKATLTVKVKVLFISKSVEITVEKTFGGGQGDPIFAQVWDVPEVWHTYAGAFA
ncbi:MAG: hypothetical protein MUF49_08195 [Oculatellaceae cyanobacterium Prado106]|nr:hypothetical protein [Oculatellaceae cyanobacterium Prado106]